MCIEISAWVSYTEHLLYARHRQAIPISQGKRELGHGRDWPFQNSQVLDLEKLLEVPEFDLRHKAECPVLHSLICGLLNKIRVEHLLCASGKHDETASLDRTVAIQDRSISLCSA